MKTKVTIQTFFFIVLLITTIFAQEVVAEFSFTKQRTREGSSQRMIENTEDRIEELADYVNGVIPFEIPTPGVGDERYMVPALTTNADSLDYIHVLRITGSAVNGMSLSNNGRVAYKAPLITLGSINGFTLNHVLRSDAAFQMTGAASLVNGDVLYFNGSSLRRLAKGTSGQFLQIGSNIPAWTSIAAPTEWSLKTTNFTTADGGRYIITDGVTSIAIHNSSVNYDEFWIKPQTRTSLAILGNGVALTGASTVAGVASTAYPLDEDVIYWFVSNGGSAYDVAGQPIDR